MFLWHKLHNCQVWLGLFFLPDPLSSAVSTTLCCHSHSLLIRSLSCRTASAQVGVLSMMHTTAEAYRKELSAKKALCRSSLERWHGNYRMGIVLFLWPEAFLFQIPWCPATTMPTQEHFTPYCCFNQAAPLKCALAQMQHHVPDRRASSFRCVNKRTCAHHCDVFTTHHCVQNCSWQAHQKFTRWTYGLQTSLQGLQQCNTLGGSCSGSPQLTYRL